MKSRVDMVYQPQPNASRLPHWRRKPFVVTVGRRSERLSRGEARRFLGRVVDALLERISAELPK